MVATRKAHSLGVTSIHENGCAEDLRTFTEAERMGKLGVRVRFNIPSAASGFARLHRSVVRCGIGLAEDWRNQDIL